MNFETYEKMMRGNYSNFAETVATVLKRRFTQTLVFDYSKCSTALKTLRRSKKSLREMVYLKTKT